MKTLLISACLLAPLFAGKVRVDTVDNATFSMYKTFQILPSRVLAKTGVIENHPANPALKEILVRELSQKGLTEVASGGDLQIQALVLTESVPQLEAVVMFGGTNNMMYDTPVATMGRYNRQGTLYINMIDRRKNRSAWLAMATESLPTRELNVEEARSKLDKAVKNIFKKLQTK